MAIANPDPECPECHGSGQIIVFSPLLDRVDEFPADCPRCAARGASPRQRGTAPPDTKKDK